MCVVTAALGSLAPACSRMLGRRWSGQLPLPATSYTPQVSALLEEEPGTARHAQFSSRRAAGEVLDAVQAAAVALGGVSRRHGDKRCAAHRAGQDPGRE